MSVVTQQVMAAARKSSANIRLDSRVTPGRQLGLSLTDQGDVSVTVLAASPEGLTLGPGEPLALTEHVSLDRLIDALTALSILARLDR